MQIHVVGLDVMLASELNAAARQALLCADCIMGSERQYDLVSSAIVENGLTIRFEPLPVFHLLAQSLKSIEQDGVEKLAVLASGDPLFYGIGRWFSNHFPTESLIFYPAISSIQAACHQLGFSLQDMTVVSLHGRPIASLRRYLKSGRKLIILTDQFSHPAALAQECVAAGFDQSTLSVCERLGYPEQKVTRHSVLSLSSTQTLDFDSLHVSVIELNGEGGILPEFPGIDDRAFETGTESGQGMLTKRHQRLAITSLLQPSSGDVIWDIGAGCGGVSVELSHWNENVTVYGVEHHPERIACLNMNRSKFGVVTNLHVVEGSAPDACQLLPSPTKVFVGGSGGDLPDILQYSWQKLPVAGVLVVSAVTEESRYHLMSFASLRENQQDAQFDTMQMAVHQGSHLAGQLVYRPAFPVTLYKWIKHS